MTRPNGWHETNNRYLSAAVTWVRHRLEALIRLQEARPEAQGGHARAHAGWGHRHHHAPPISEDRDVIESARTMDAIEREMGDHPPTLVELGERLALRRPERDVLLLCAGVEYDSQIAGLCGQAQGDPTRDHPTFALGLVLFDHVTWDILSPERPLRHWRLIEITQPGAQPLLTSALRADERIVNYFKGLDYLDDRLAVLVGPLPLPGGTGPLPPSQWAAARRIRHAWDPETVPFPMPVAQLVGPDPTSKELVAWHAARASGRVPYRVAAEALPHPGPDLEQFIRLWQRDCNLYPQALYIDAQEADPNAPGPALPAGVLLSRSSGAFFLATREAWARLEGPSLLVDVDRPTRAEQQEIWEEALGDNADEIPARLAGQFHFNSDAIRRIVRSVLAEADDDGLADRLWDECRSAARPRLEALAQRLEPKVTWDDLVLPDEPLSLLHQLTDQVDQRARVYEEWGFARKLTRGMGITALFIGESGTGKTLAAEVIAHELRLDLYRIDLSAVVSKYIGETEKNLRRLFDAAEDGGCILFFDEADALFGKRSEVKDSHDRYANIEVNYLLQRMEAFRGLAILATNRGNALDVAFQRRIRFRVKFPHPDRPHRRQIWERVFPHETPVEGLDYDRLARLDLTGGSIRNIAVNAAFLAAHRDESVTMPLVLAAARAEFAKADRPINEADFRWQEPAGAYP